MTTETEQATTEQTTTEQGNNGRNQDMSGALFRNNKGDNPKRPDYRGRCKIDGKERRISGWLKTDRNGNHFLSLSFQDEAPQNSSDPILSTQDQ